MRALRTILAAVFVSGCVMAGTPFSDQQDLLKVPEPGEAKFVFYWPKQQYDVSPKGARIRINDEIAESIGYLRYYSIDVDAGEYKIEVDTWNNPGRCQLIVSTLPDDVRYFEVQTRSSYVEKMEVGSIFSPIPGADLVTGVAIASESIGKECGGVFSVAETSKADAFSKIQSTFPNNPNKSVNSQP